MFPTAGENPARNIGRLNQEAAEAILSALRIPVLARDVGGEAGRNMTLDPSTGRVWIRSPSGDGREI
jgi:chemotaxis protein CheD